MCRFYRKSCVTASGYRIYISHLLHTKNDNNIRSAVIDTSVGGKVVLHYLAVQPPTTASEFGGQQVNISELVRIYADPLTTIELAVNTWNSSKDFRCEFSLSGQAVTVP